MIFFSSVVNSGPFQGHLGEPFFSFGPSGSVAESPAAFRAFRFFASAEADLPPKSSAPARLLPLWLEVCLFWKVFTTPQPPCVRVLAVDSRVR